MSERMINEVSDVDPHLIRIAKALARDLGEDCPDAYYYYIGPAVMYRNEKRRNNTDAELERLTLEAETC
jgi:hypothetical protein